MENAIGLNDYDTVYRLLDARVSYSSAFILDAISELDYVFIDCIFSDKRPRSW